MLWTKKKKKGKKKKDQNIPAIASNTHPEPSDSLHRAYRGTETASIRRDGAKKRGRRRRASRRRRARAGRQHGKACCDLRRNWRKRERSARRGGRRLLRRRTRSRRPKRAMDSTDPRWFCKSISGKIRRRFSIRIRLLLLIFPDRAIDAVANRFETRLSSSRLP